MSTPDLYRSSSSTSGGSRSGSSSVSFDYTELDNQRKLAEAASALDAKKFQALYGGDIAGAMAIGKQQEGLLRELAKPASVRVRSTSSNSSRGKPTYSEGYSQVREEDGGASEPRDIPDPEIPKQTPKPQEPTEGLIMPEMDMNANPVAGLRPKTFRPYV